MRREGELYTQAQAEGKRGDAPAQDGHKSGDNGSLDPFSRPRKGAGATGAAPRTFMLIHKQASDTASSSTGPAPFVASCFRALALLAEPAKKEEGAQASSPHPFNWNISMRLGLLTGFNALLSDWQSPH